MSKQEMGYKLASAAACGDVGEMRAALAEGADVHFDADLALRAAVISGQLQAAEFLLDQRADVAACDQEALFYAGLRGDCQMVRLLLQKGANVEEMIAARQEKELGPCLDTIAFATTDDISRASVAVQDKVRAKVGSGFKLKW